MMKEFWAIIEAMGLLETKLRNTERHHAATQIRVLRGFMQAIYLGVMTSGPDNDTDELLGELDEEV